MTTGPTGTGAPGGAAGGGSYDEPVTQPIARQAPPADAPPRRLLLLVAIAVVVLAADLATKIAIVAALRDGQRIDLLGPDIALVLVRNPGAAFSLATGLTWVLTVVAVAIVVGIVRYARRLRSPGWAVALGLVLGGATGNLVDRFFRGPGPMEGHVVDFVSLGWWPVFNVADSSICIGGAVLVLLALSGREIDGTRREPAPGPPPPRLVGGLDPDDERVVRALKTPWPTNKWDARADGSAAEDPDAPTSTGDDPDDLVDEDDRLPTDRPRHPANKWER